MEFVASSRTVSGTVLLTLLMTGWCLDSTVSVACGRRLEQIPGKVASDRPKMLLPRHKIMLGSEIGPDLQIIKGRTNQLHSATVSLQKLPTNVQGQISTQTNQVQGQIDGLQNLPPQLQASLPLPSNNGQQNGGLAPAGIQGLAGAQQKP